MRRLRQLRVAAARLCRGRSQGSDSVRRRNNRLNYDRSLKRKVEKKKRLAPAFVNNRKSTISNVLPGGHNEEALRSTRCCSRNAGTLCGASGFRPGVGNRQGRL